MNDCVVKLRAIKSIANEGMQNSIDAVERNKFEQISIEVSYLINESKIDEVVPIMVSEG
jgi:hypothetical protein